MGVYIPCIFLIHYGITFGHDREMEENGNVFRRESLHDAVKLMYKIGMGVLYAIIAIDMALLIFFGGFSEEIRVCCVLSVLWPLMLPLLLINHKGKWIGFATILLLIPICIDQAGLEQIVAEGTTSNIVAVILVSIILAGISLLLSIIISKRLERSIIGC